TSCVAGASAPSWIWRTSGCRRRSAPTPRARCRSCSSPGTVTSRPGPRASGSRTAHSSTASRATPRWTRSATGSTRAATTYPPRSACESRGGRRGRDLRPAGRRRGHAAAAVSAVPHVLHRGAPHRAGRGDDGRTVPRHPPDERRGRAHGRARRARIRGAQPVPVQPRALDGGPVPQGRGPGGPQRRRVPGTDVLHATPAPGDQVRVAAGFVQRGAQPRERGGGVALGAPASTCRAALDRCRQLHHRHRWDQGPAATAASDPRTAGRGLARHRARASAPRARTHLRSGRLMLSEYGRSGVTRVAHPFATLLVRAGVTANGITLTGLLLTCAAAVGLFGTGHLVVG